MTRRVSALASRAPARLGGIELGIRIRDVRLACYSDMGPKIPRGQRWLADRVGVSQPTICRWEQGLRAISRADLQAVARALYTTTRDLEYR